MIWNIARSVIKVSKLEDRFLQDEIHLLSKVFSGCITLHLYPERAIWRPDTKKLIELFTNQLVTSRVA
jgi:hypothetical protein